MGDSSSWREPWGVLTLAALLLVFDAAPGRAADLVVSREVFVDPSRPTRAVAPFEGASDRRLETWVWHPEDLEAGGPWPLIVYSHGTFGRPDNATHFVEMLAKNGYLVAAPVYPLTSSLSHAGLSAADVTDGGNQPADLRFVIDSLLAHPRFGPAIDASRIGATGISLGGVTTYFATFAFPTRDPRIAASALIGAGDPVYAALSYGLGFAGVMPAPVPVPALLLEGDADVFTWLTGGPGANYARLVAPKYWVQLAAAPHVWFGNRDHVPPDDRNPDCDWFEANAGMVPPICRQRRPLIEPARQKEITREALLAFFDAHLKGDEAARKRLLSLGERAPEVTLRYEVPKAPVAAGAP